MENDRKTQLQTVKREIEFHLEHIQNFIAEFQSSEFSDSYKVYAFQSLMDGLSSPKKKADNITRTLDHG